MRDGHEHEWGVREMGQDRSESVSLDAQLSS